MDFSMFEDLPDMQRFLKDRNVSDSMNDFMNTIGGMNAPKQDKSTFTEGAADSNKNNNGRFPKKTPLAMAYVPKQEWDKTYNNEKGFDKGTVFPELDLPFAPEEGCYDTER